MEMLAKFVDHARDGARSLSIDQRDCEQLDLCAATVLNVLGLEARVRLRTAFDGQYPGSPEAREIVAATGLPKLLKAKVPDVGNFLVFRLRHGGLKPRPSLYRPSLKEEVSSDLAKYLDECLGLYGYGFSPAARQYAGQLTGEVLGNAEDHAPMWPWYVAAYLRQPEGKDFGDCHLTFLNFGPTLAETLKSLETGSELRRRIEALVDLHRQSRFFGILRPEWTEEGLWTLYALQEFVTRHFGSDNVLSRGVGTADMIEAFQSLGRSAESGYRPRMCIVSGNTQILFDDNPSHRMRAAELEGVGGVRTIAFNAENDLRKPPDPGTVRKLKRFFPGTVISLRFYLDERYLDQVHNTRENASENN